MAPIDSSRPSVLRDPTQSVSQWSFSATCLRYLHRSHWRWKVAADDMRFQTRYRLFFISRSKSSIVCSSTPAAPCCSSPFGRLPELLAVKYSTVLPCPLGSSHLWLAQRTWLHYTHPFAPSAFTDFVATTGCSAPWCRIRTFALVVQST